MTTSRRGALRALTALTLAGTLAACGSGTTTTEPAGTSTPAGETLTVTDGWVKATDEGMTGAFGTLKNTGEQAVVITGGSSEIAGDVEAHVMVEGDDGNLVMTEAEDGHTIPAGGELVLEPGGPHLMLMKLSEPVVAGEDYVITVTTVDEQSIDLSFAGREFSGAQEEYEPDMSHDEGEMSSDDEGEMSHDGTDSESSTTSSSSS